MGEEKEERERREKVVKRKKRKRQRKQTGERMKEERLKGEKERERKRSRKKKEKGARLRHAGSMPTNYECKVMVILISSAERGKKMAVIKPREKSLYPSSAACASVFGLSLFLSLPQHTLFRTFSRTRRACLSCVR